MKRDIIRTQHLLPHRSRVRRLFLEPLEPRLCMALTVPALSSLPGANHSIYLDFDGHITSGTTWNNGYYRQDPIISPAWSSDSDRSNFTDAELSAIERIWKRVAEDFSPFNVNVTTVEPSISDLRRGEVAGDTKWGVRAVVTIETTNTRCGCGGIAYIGSFNDFYDEPVFIYNSGEYGVSEAISHEVGHSLYLAHDGTLSGVEYYGGHGSGVTSWAPIMGNSYSRNVTTWDNSVYYNANNTGSGANYGNGPDDLAVITTKNGFGFRPDDHGGNDATASALTVFGNSLSGGGIIANQADADYFSFFTAEGPVSLAVQSIPDRGNLDVQIELFDSAGNLLLSDNPGASLNASINSTLAAGAYYLRVKGAGFGNPTVSPPSGYTAYSSIGQYSISGTIVDPSSLPTVSVTDVSVSEVSGSARFLVRLNGTISETVTVNFETKNGTAQINSDYLSTFGTLTFLASDNVRELEVVVPLIDDSVPEPSEAFSLVLSGISANALISDGVGTATIRNDDAAFSINNASVIEGNISKKGVATNTTASFTVFLVHPVDGVVSFTYATGLPGDTAIAGTDYLSASSEVAIPAGQTSVAVPITVIGDNVQEANEVFSVIITTQSGDVTNSVGIGTIVDNDAKAKGGGNGGGRPAPDELVPEDFTIIDHIDFAEPDFTGLAHDHLHSQHDHSHTHEHVAHQLDLKPEYGRRNLKVSEARATDSVPITDDLFMGFESENHRPPISRAVASADGKLPRDFVINASSGHWAIVGRQSKSPARSTRPSLSRSSSMRVSTSLVASEVDAVLGDELLVSGIVQ